MIKKLLQNLWVKVATESWLLSLVNFFYYSLILFFPTQLGKHFWPSWSYVYGQRVDYLSPTLYVTDILIFLLFCITILRKQLQFSTFFLLTVLYLAFNIFFSQSPFAGWYALLKFCELCFVAYYTARNIRGLDQQKLGLILGLGVIFESMLAFAQFFLHGSVGSFFYLLGERTFTSETPGIANASIHGTLVLRPYGTFSHPNVLAAFLLFGMLFVWYFFTKTKNNWRDPFLWSVSLCGSLGLLLTLSRTTILLGFMFVALSILGKLSKKQLLVLVGASVILVVFFPTLLYRFAPNTFEESAAIRVQLMQRAFLMITSHPFFGVGLNNFLYQLPSQSLIQPVHNIALLWLSETGIIGLAIAFFFFSNVFKGCQRAWKKTSEHGPLTFLFASGVFVITLGMFDHYFLTLQQGQLLFAFIVGILISL